MKISWYNTPNVEEAPDMYLKQFLNWAKDND